MELRHSRHFMCMNTQNLQSICINNYLYGYPPTYGNGNGFCVTTSKSIYHVPFDFSIFVILNVVPSCSSISLSDPKVCCLIIPSQLRPEPLPKPENGTQYNFCSSWRVNIKYYITTKPRTFSNFHRPKCTFCTCRSNNAFISASVAVLKLAKPNFFNATSLSPLCNHISKLYDDLLIMPSMSGIRCRPNCALVWLP